MRAPGGITLPDAAVCAIALTITLCCCGCDAADVYRAERGLHVQAAANAATSTPKGNNNDIPAPAAVRMSGAVRVRFGKLCDEIHFTF